MIDRTKLSTSETPSPTSPPPGGAAVQLRLYVARTTPNSVRAERNLSMVLSELAKDLTPPVLEIVDVFSQPKRAITDGIVVTPTLVGLAGDKRITLMGDLADQCHLKQILEDFLGADRSDGAIVTALNPSH